MKTCKCCNAVVGRYHLFYCKEYGVVWDYQTQANKP